MSASIFSARSGTPSLCASVLLILFAFSSSIFSQTIDPTFAPLLQDFGNVFNRANARGSALQPDGKILVGGQFTVAGGLARAGVARFNAGGTPDAGFDAGNISVAEGLLTTETGGTINVIKVYPDGKILISGTFRRDEEGGIIKTIERLNPDGSRDATFRSPIIEAGIGDAEIQPDGKIVVVGYFTSIAGAARQRIARLNADGTIDAGFNLPNGANNIIYDFSLQADGRILVAGAFTKLGNKERIGAARLLDSSRAQFDFDGDGRADISVFRPSDGVWYLLRSSAGFSAAQFGLSADKPSPADYYGDGKSDLAVFRDGTWYLQQSTSGFAGVQFGQANDVAVPSAYIP